MFSLRSIIIAFLSFLGVVALAGGVWFYQTVYSAHQQLGLGDPPVPVAEATWPALPPEGSRTTYDLGFATIDLPADVNFIIEATPDYGAAIAAVEEQKIVFLPPFPKAMTEFAEFPPELARQLADTTMVQFRYDALTRKSITAWEMFTASREEKLFLIAAAVERFGGSTEQVHTRYTGSSEKGFLSVQEDDYLLLYERENSPFAQTFAVTTETEWEILFPFLRTFRFKPAFDGTPETMAALIQAAGIPELEPEVPQEPVLEQNAPDGE